MKPISAKRTPLVKSIDVGNDGLSLQVADVVIVSVDTRGFSLAEKLATLGWKTVVIELSGSAFNSEIEWADRLGPFLPWEHDPALAEKSEKENQGLRESYASLWLPSGPLAFGGHRAEAGLAHLSIRYGILPGAKRATTLEKGWPEAMARSLVDSKLSRRESYLASPALKLRLPLEAPVKNKVSADAVAKARCEAAVAAGARILDAEQITAVRLSDGRIDRIEFVSRDGNFVERTRSLVWMLSEEESRRAEFVSPDVPFDEFVVAGRGEPLMAWWRNRLAVRGLKNANSETLRRVPETPPHVVVLGSIERPWTHDNLLLLDVVEETPQMRVFDVWTRIPYWARVDHVYRDEQRTLAQNLLADRFAGCQLVWVTPSPLALTEPAIRMPHVLYSEESVAARGRLENICFAGPESWPGVGLHGLRSMEDAWLKQLEGMRIQWDPVARLHASRLERMKYAVKKFGKRADSKPRNDEASL